MTQNDDRDPYEWAIVVAALAPIVIGTFLAVAGVAILLIRML